MTTDSIAWPDSLMPVNCSPAMANYVMVAPEVADALALSGTLVLEEELADARRDVDRTHNAAVAAAADAVLFEDGPQEAQEGASAIPDVEVEAGVARKPRKARAAADGSQPTPVEV